MITKTELDETINNLTEKFNHIAEELERLWQFTNSKAISSNNADMKEIANRIEHIQFDEYANPSQFASIYRFNEFYKILKENESVKNLDKLMEYERIMKSIQRLSKDIDEINLENKE